MPLPANSSGLTGAAADLGLGGMLADQVAGETEEQRKKRMQMMQERQMTGPGGSLATLSLYGGGARGGGYTY